MTDRAFELHHAGDEPHLLREIMRTQQAVINVFSRQVGMPAARLALATGFCGGFTTMSSLIYEAAAMARGGGVWQAAGYLAGTLALSAAGFAAGLVMVRALARLGGGAWN